MECTEPYTLHQTTFMQLVKSRRTERVTPIQQVNSKREPPSYPRSISSAARYSGLLQLIVSCLLCLIHSKPGCRLYSFLGYVFISISLEYGQYHII